MGVVSSALLQLKILTICLLVVPYPISFGVGCSARLISRQSPLPLTLRSRTGGLGKVQRPMCGEEEAQQLGIPGCLVAHSIMWLIISSVMLNVG